LGGRARHERTLLRKDAERRRGARGGAREGRGDGEQERGPDAGEGHGGGMVSLNSRPMRLGIDFGTTHTVAALVDRGNYPVVSFEWGDAVPSEIAVRESDGSLRFGTEAASVGREKGWTLIRSFKRLLNEAGPLTQ